MKKINVISTVVQRSQSGQRVPTGNTIIVEGGGSVDVDALKYEISKDFLKRKEDDRAEGRINFLKGIAINGKVIEGVDTSEEGSEPSDTSVPTSKRVEKRYLRKDKDDRSMGTISSDKGFEVGRYEEGLLGAGASMHEDEDGRTYMEADYLTIRKKATFNTITVQELKHIGGALVLSPASMVCIGVKERMDGYKCYFRQTDADGRKLYNEFEPGDQARCQTFSLQKNVYYWRLVTEVGEDYIVLSKTDCDAGSDVPREGDNISLLGNRTKADRQSAIVLSAYGEDAPSYKQYRGINSYSLEGKQVTKLSPDGNELSGVVNIEAGSTGAKNLEDFPDEVFKAVHIGAVNLLLNSGFTGDYQSEELSSGYALAADGETYSKGLKHWTGMAMVVADDEAVSGRSVEIGSLLQRVNLIKGESYVISFKAKGSQVAVSCGGFSDIKLLAAEYGRCEFKFVSDGTGDFIISGTAKVCDIQLERGTIATDWGASPYDNDKTLAEFQALKYIQDAIREGDTSIIGGLVLSSMIQLGNYKDGKMQKVNAGVSGVYNDDNDVAFWAGGNLEEAIKTVIKFKENPRYRPTDAEWRGLANFVVSHGGDVFLRGYVYALGGFFRGAVEIAEGKIMLNDDGSGHLASNNIRWTKEGIMYRKAPENIEWKKITDFRQAGVVSYNSGLYFDLGTHIGDRTPYELPFPEYEYFTVFVKASLPSRSSGSAVLESVFRVYDGSGYVNVSYLEIEDESTDYQLVFESSVWYVRGGKYSVVDRVVNGVEAKVVVLGLQTQLNVGDDVESRTELKKDGIKTQRIEVLDTSEDSIHTDGGITAGNLKLKENIARSRFLASPIDSIGAPTFRSISDDDINGYAELKTSVEKLGERMDDVEGALDVISNGLSGIDGRVDDLDSSISSLGSSISSLRSSIRSLESEISDLSSRVSSLESADSGSGEGGTEQ